MGNKSITELLKIDKPIIMMQHQGMAGYEMLKQGLENGLAVCVNIDNYHHEYKLRKLIEKLKLIGKEAISLSLDTGEFNVNYYNHIDLLKKIDIDFVVTSDIYIADVLNIPKDKGFKVICNINDLNHSLELKEQGVDAIMVNNDKSSSHKLNMSGTEVYNNIKDIEDLPKIIKGGIIDSEDISYYSDLGYDGFAASTVFTYSEESDSEHNYKNTCIENENDILIDIKINETIYSMLNNSKLEKYIKYSKLFSGYLPNKSGYILYHIFRIILTLKIYKHRFIYNIGGNIDRINEIKTVKDIVEAMAVTEK